VGNLQDESYVRFHFSTCLCLAIGFLTHGVLQHHTCAFLPSKGIERRNVVLQKEVGIPEAETAMCFLNVDFKQTIPENASTESAQRDASYVHLPFQLQNVAFLADTAL